MRIVLAYMLVTIDSGPATAECFAWPVESVYDGDTLRATVEGQSTRIRLMGLDTPEMPPRAKCEAERAGAYAARDRLRALLRGAVVAFCPDGQDRYGRTLAVVLADGRDVAEVLIGEGRAREYHGGRRAGWCE